jgi:hypothetical protein
MSDESNHPELGVRHVGITHPWSTTFLCTKVNLKLSPMKTSPVICSNTWDLTSQNISIGNENEILAIIPDALTIILYSCEGSRCLATGSHPGLPGVLRLSREKFARQDIRHERTGSWRRRWTLRHLCSGLKWEFSFSSRMTLITILPLVECRFGMKLRVLKLWYCCIASLWGQVLSKYQTEVKWTRE